MRNRSENLECKLFAEQDGAFGLAAWAEISCSTRERQQMFLMTFRATDTCESSLKPSARQELFNGAYNYRTQGSGMRFEAFFIGPDIAVKMSFKQLIQCGSFGMSRMVLGRRFRNNTAFRNLIRIKACFGCIKGNRLKPECHEGL